MFKFKAKIGGEWIEFDFHDVYGGKIEVDGVDQHLPTENLVRLFSGKHDKWGEPIYFGDVLEPKYNGLIRFIATYETINKYNLNKCELLEGC